MNQALLSKHAAEDNAAFPYGTIHAQIPECSPTAVVISSVQEEIAEEDLAGRDLGVGPISTDILVCPTCQLYEQNMQIQQKLNNPPGGHNWLVQRRWSKHDASRGNTKMLKAEVTEEEIQTAEKLRGQGEFATAIALTQDMLCRVEDGDMRMRLLFDVLYCSTRLRLDKVTDDAIAELERLPEPKMSRVFVDFIQAMSYIAQGNAQEGLDLIDANLKSAFMETDEFQIWKYKHLAYKGSALIWLARTDDALAALAQAHAIFPDGERETAILIDQSNCLLALDRYEDGRFQGRSATGLKLRCQYFTKSKLGRKTSAGHFQSRDLRGLVLSAHAMASRSSWE